MYYESTFAHYRDRGRVPDHRPTDTRTAFLYHGDFGRGQTHLARAGQTRAAPGDGRGRAHRMPDFALAAERAGTLATYHYRVGSNVLHEDMLCRQSSLYF